MQVSVADQSKEAQAGKRDENQELTLMAGGKIAEAGGRSDFTPCHQR